MYAVGETPTTFSNLQCHITVSDVCNRCHGFTEEMVAMGSCSSRCYEPQCNGWSYRLVTMVVDMESTLSDSS